MNNSNLENYINQYLNDLNPEFAILIDGPWGIGKTFFIKNFITSIPKNKIHRGNFITIDPFYISLNGINQISQINDKIKELLFPMLYSKGAKVAKKALTILSKGAITFESTNNINIDLNYDITSILKGNNNLTGSKTFIFDDLERCQLSIEETFGYINDLVEHNNCHIIIVADENKLISNDKNNSYNKIKEKTIGQTFLLYSEIDKILIDFIKKIETQDCQTFCTQNIETIREIFYLSDCSNLRLLKRGLKKFEYFFNHLDFNNVNKQKAEDLKLFLLIYILSYSIEFNLGEINIDYYNYYLSMDILFDAGIPDIKNIKSKYKHLMSGPFFTINNFTDYRKSIFNYIKNFDYEELLEHCNQHLRPKTEIFIPTYKNLECYFQLTDEEFNKSLDNLEKDFFIKDRYNKLNIDDIVTSVEFLLRFLENKLYSSKTEKEIIDQYLLLINNLDKKYFLDNFTKNETLIRPILHFYNRDIEKKEKLHDIINRIIKNKRFEIKQDFFNNLLKYISDKKILEIDSFFTNKNKGDYKLLFSNFDFEKLKTAILALKENISIDYLSNFIYGHYYKSKKDNSKEVEIINHLIIEIKKEIQAKHLYPLRIFNLKNLITILDKIQIEN